jgi:hypothetical protein
LFLNFFGLVFGIHCMTLGAAGEEKKPQSRGGLRQRLFNERFKELKKQELEMQGELKELVPELKEQLQKRASGPLPPLDEGKEKDLGKKKRESARQDLEGAAKKLSQKEIDGIKNRNERLSDKFLKAPVEEKPGQEGKTAKKPVPGQSKSAPFDADKSKAAPSRTFKKGIEKSPTEYGNSTATPGEAEKEAIEYQGKSSKKKPKAEDADQE